MSKLLVGLHPADRQVYTHVTIFGVASLLCRLRLRPLSSSPLAPHMVADFMTVLANVSFECDRFHVASYSCDPILAFGAARLWHTWLADSRSMLADCILPEFRKLLCLDAVDIGRGVGDVVARILLLLAVDACGPMANGPLFETAF